MDGATLGGRIAQELQRLGLDGSKSFEAAQLLAQTTLSLLGGLVVAILAYWLIHANQIRAARDGRKIERARLLHDLDREYFNLMASRCLIKARRSPKAAYAPDELWNLEYALTSKVIWYPAVPVDAEGGRIYHPINHARFVRIHPDWLIDTLILHHVAAWARRIGNGVEAGILDRRDVAGMWRNILPWARDNRFSFMMDMFGSTALGRLKASGALRPTEETPLGYVRAVWPLRGRRRLIHQITAPWRSLRRVVTNWIDARRTLRRTPPPSWPGDIVPLYAIIHTVIDQSMAHGQLDALDYVQMIGAAPDQPTRMDDRLRRTLLAP